MPSARVLSGQQRPAGHRQGPSPFLSVIAAFEGWDTHSQATGLAAVTAASQDRISGRFEGGEGPRGLSRAPKSGLAGLWDPSQLAKVLESSTFGRAVFDTFLAPVWSRLGCLASPGLFELDDLSGDSRLGIHAGYKFYGS